MAWTKPGAVTTAKISNDDLSARFCFDTFTTGLDGDGEPITERALRCDFTIASDATEDQTHGFKVTDALTASERTALMEALAKCRDHALTLAGFTEG